MENGRKRNNLYIYISDGCKQFGGGPTKDIYISDGMQTIRW